VTKPIACLASLVAILLASPFQPVVAQGEHMGHSAAVQTKDSAIVTKAIAVLHPTQGSTVTGTVTFTKESAGVRVVADLTGLTPGTHGFHIHEFGDCSAPDAASAGGHFNPGHAPHAGPDADARHAGDLGNITADSAGVAHYERLDPHMSLTGPNSIIGRGVIVHEKADDLTTQPTGAAGGRVACGIIGVTKP
jgi:Cu-Zn family superoxide dismutase